MLPSRYRYEWYSCKPGEAKNGWEGSIQSLRWSIAWLIPWFPHLVSRRMRKLVSVVVRNWIYCPFITTALGKVDPSHLRPWFFLNFPPQGTLRAEDPASIHVRAVLETLCSATLSPPTVVWQDPLSLPPFNIASSESVGETSGVLLHMECFSLRSLHN